MYRLPEPPARVDTSLYAEPITRREEVDGTSKIKNFVVADYWGLSFAVSSASLKFAAIVALDTRPSPVVYAYRHL